MVASMIIKIVIDRFGVLALAEISLSRNLRCAGPRLGRFFVSIFAPGEPAFAVFTEV
jgi:hypothetical protein